MKFIRIVHADVCPAGISPLRRGGLKGTPKRNYPKSPAASINTVPSHHRRTGDYSCAAFSCLWAVRKCAAPRLSPGAGRHCKEGSRRRYTSKNRARLPLASRKTGQHAGIRSGLVLLRYILFCIGIWRKIGSKGNQQELCTEHRDQPRHDQ